MNFPIYIINHILSFRPTHPCANLLKRDMSRWSYRKRTSFNIYYFSLLNTINSNINKERKYNDERKDYYFKCCLQDGYCLEQIVKLRYEQNQRKKRLNLKLKELNLNIWEIETHTTNNSLIAYHKNKEIFNEKCTIDKKKANEKLYTELELLEQEFERLIK